MARHMETQACEGEDNGECRTELDSHANMAVVGRHAYILNRSTKTVDVAPFSSEYDAMKDVPIVDAILAHDDPYSGEMYLLVLFNALYIKSMDHNLVTPFIMREAGVIVNEVAKIHVTEPTVEDHSIYFPVRGRRIPLALWGIFSYFPTRKPTMNELEAPGEVLKLTPDAHDWNPHSDVFARNEENMVDWEGNMIEAKHRTRILMEDIPDVDTDDMVISALESMRIDSTFENLEPIGMDEDYAECVGAAAETDTVHVVLSEVDANLNQVSLSEKLQERLKASEYAISVGATHAMPELTSFLFDDDDPGGYDSNDVSISEAVGFDDEELMEYFQVSATTASRPKGVSAEHLSKVWRIDLDAAKKTLDVTTQLLKTGDHTSRNYSTNDRMLRYNRINQHFFMDTFFASKNAGKTKKGFKSTRGYTMMQLFVTDKGFVYVVPMRKKSEVYMAMKQFAKEIGAPEAFICDKSGEQTSKEVKEFVTKIGSSLRILEEGTPWANRAELYIGLMKAGVRKDMKVSGCPLVFWDYCAERRARINNMTARNLFQLEGRNAHFATFGTEGDISNLCRFDWYEWVIYREQTANFPEGTEALGRVLGPAKGEGNEMAQWILKPNGKVVPRRTVRPLEPDEWNSETEKRKRKIFDELIEKRWGTCWKAPDDSAYDSEDSPDQEFETYEDDDETAREMPEIDDPIDVNGVPINQQPAYDRLIRTELLMPQGDRMVEAKVIGRTVGPDGRTVGRYNDNPILNTCVYDIEFPDGDVKEYSANVIAENLLSQVDLDGFHVRKFECILEYRFDDTAVLKKDMQAIDKDGRKRLRQTTRGWKLLVKFQDGSTEWFDLKDLKEAYPVELAEYAKAERINDQPAFAWWVPYTLRKRERIVAAFKSRVRKATHKYGIEIPRDIEHAYALDKTNGNTFWRDAIKKEMVELGVAFEILDDGQLAPVGWSKQSGHLVFDAKMSLERKARWCLDGHKTADPEISTYAGVVSRESVRIALTYAALNGVDVTAADIGNAYLQAPSSQKYYIICGPEFGLENVGKVALIRRALYGGKTAGRDFRNHLRECMSHLKFTSCPADPDVWMRPAKTKDGSEYWEYVLLYVDDVLIVSDRGEEVLRTEIGKYFKLKEKSIGPPKIYLGGRMRQVKLENGMNAWTFSSSQYVQAAVSNVETYLTQKGLKFQSRAPNTPLSSNYRPEVDVTPELGPVEAAYYQSLIGILRWMVELGRVDICLEVSMMSSHLCLPREGHLGQLFHMFAYLKKYHNSEMVFDPSDPVIDESLFERKDWATSEFGSAVKEEMPRNMPQTRGLGFVLRAFVDADHAGDSMTRRSRTGFLVYLNSAPVYWLSRKQNSVETSSFGSEFTAMKNCTEYLRGLRYKLRMMGIPVEGPAYVLGDNQSVLANTSVPDSTLKKKSQSIAYHFVREGAARDEWRTAYVNTHFNPADLLTKPLPAGDKRSKFVRMILHHLFGKVE